MELMQQTKGYSDSREEEDDDEAAEIITITREEEGSRLHQQDAASNNFISHRKQLDFMDLSLGSINKDEEANFQQGSSSVGVAVGGVCRTTPQSHHATTCSSSSPSSSNNINEAVEKEHMFDKVVTPSDVGKLNRLVIPKQHAEKYFPLDASSNEKGLLLNFEDRNGKLWRFRYSYWNSSQSYVMTKGWSRFVKEKKLDAGDIVSFQRGLGDLYRHRLYIDWRRRPDHVHPTDPSTPLISPLFLPNHYSIRWGANNRFYSLPSPPPAATAASSTMPPPRHGDHFHHQHLNYSNHMYTLHYQQQQYYGGGGGSGSHHIHNNNNYSEVNLGSGSVYYPRSTTSMSMQMADQINFLGQQQERGNISPMIIDSVPVAHHPLHQHQHHHHHGVTTTTTTTNSASISSSAGKRLRLFGVNMECASSPVEDSICLSSSASAAHMTMANSLTSSSTPPQREATNSVVFDLDPSLQYRQ